MIQAQQEISCCAFYLLNHFVYLVVKLNAMRSRTWLKLSFVLNILLVITLFIIGFQTELYRFHGKEDIRKEHVEELFRLAETSLITNDVPVGALVLYDGNIIGEGFNTVYGDNNICGHAEINALNDAINKMGIRNFLQLDRDKLKVLSTFEPCEMCKGTLNHYRIRNLNFIRGKSYGTWIRNHWASFKYELTKKKSPGSELQDSLFMLHPEYPGKK